MNIKQQIGCRIMQLRKEKGWNQSELGEKIGIPRQNVSRIETGKISIGVEKLDQIAKIFGKDIKIE